MEWLRSWLEALQIVLTAVRCHWRSRDFVRLAGAVVSDAAKSGAAALCGGKKFHRHHPPDRGMKRQVFNCIHHSAWAAHS